MSIKIYIWNEILGMSRERTVWKIRLTCFNNILESSERKSLFFFY